MTIAERNTHIQDLQIDHLAYGTKLCNRLSYGSSCYNDLDTNAKIHYMIRAWYRYWALPSALTYFSTIDVTAISTAVTFRLAIDADYITATTALTDATTSNINQYIIDAINALSATTSVYAFEHDGEVLIYSTNTDHALGDNLSWNLTVGTSTSSETKLDTEDDVSILLDANNCLTYAQMCNMKKYTKNLMSTCR